MDGWDNTKTQTDKNNEKFYEIKLNWKIRVSIWDRYYCCAKCESLVLTVVKTQQKLMVYIN